MKRLVILSVILLTGCALTTLFQAASVTVTPTPDCVPMFMSTGEVFFAPTMQVTPPAEVRAGQDVRIQFEGGMMLMPSGQTCGSEATVYLPNRATAENVIRKIHLKLGGTVVYTQACGYHCTLEFAVPLDVVPGDYVWDLGLFGFDTPYPVQVLAQ